MTRRRAAWLAARHIALWPWPSRDEPALPTGHPWLAELAWLRSRRVGVLAVACAWLGAALASAGWLLYVPLLTHHQTPAAATPAAGRVPAYSRPGVNRPGRAGAHLSPGGAR